MIHLDTSFLVDLLREAEEPGPAARRLEDLLDEDLWISIFVACELEAGVELAIRPDRERQRVAELLTGLQVSSPGDSFPSIYGRLFADLERQGRRIATMDLLIGSAAIEAEAALVSRDAGSFGRISGLRVLSY